LPRSTEHQTWRSIVKIAGTLMGKSGESRGMKGKAQQRVSPEKSGY
jgi:hypothetical protein